MTFDEIPQNIKNTFFSERVDGLLDEIREEACIVNLRLLPNIFYKLIAKEIPPHFFVESLAETGIGEKIAQSVAKAIKERILESERYPLLQWGIDISDIKVSDAENLEALGLKEDLAKEEKNIPLESLSENEPAETFIPIIKGEESPRPIEGEGATPFILQEKPKESMAAASGVSGKVIPSFSTGFFKTKKNQPVGNSQKTIKANVEIPSQKKESKKVVHYSEIRSAPSTFESGDEFLKTEEIAPLADAAEKNQPQEEIAPPGKTIPPPSENMEQKTTINELDGGVSKNPIDDGPTIEGNIINLKK